MNAKFVIRAVTIFGILWTLGTLAYLYSGGKRISPYLPFVGLLIISIGASQVRRVRKK